VVVRLAIKIFCRKIIINKPEVLKEKGPLLLACNHPNSFLDGVIFDTLFNESIYTLARGDAFVKGPIKKILIALKLLPVYRVSEGVENLDSNYDTFDECKKIFRQNGIILIFSEGKCINEWHLRPLKKGTARLAIASWDENIPLRVLPVGINYSSFRRFSKNLFINFGEVIKKNDLEATSSDGVRYQAFNTMLEKQLKQLVFEIDKKDKEKQQRLLEIKPSIAKKILLTVPAFIGWLIHWPVYLPIKSFTFKRTNLNDHYDSVLTGILLFAYPLYLLVIAIVVFYFSGSWFAFLLLPLAPLTAWSYAQLKPQLDK
jgi:1-acyl-sn-glycerol-3-phosphate acyltransferase